jgi:hypothetical protein
MGICQEGTLLINCQLADEELLASRNLRVIALRLADGVVSRDSMLPWQLGHVESTASKSRDPSFEQKILMRLEYLLEDTCQSHSQRHAPRSATFPRRDRSLSTMDPR